MIVKSIWALSLIWWLIFIMTISPTSFLGSMPLPILLQQLNSLVAN
jgi:hypothetical protein